MDFDRKADDKQNGINPARKSAGNENPSRNCGAIGLPPLLHLFTLHRKNAENQTAPALILSSRFYRDPENCETPLGPFRLPLAPLWGVKKRCYATLRISCDQPARGIQPDALRARITH